MAYTAARHWLFPYTMHSAISLIVVLLGVITSTMAVSPVNSRTLAAVSKRASGYSNTCSGSAVSGWELSANCPLNGNGGAQPASIDLSNCLQVDFGGNIVCSPR